VVKWTWCATYFSFVVAHDNCLSTDDCPTCHQWVNQCRLHHLTTTAASLTWNTTYLYSTVDYSPALITSSIHCIQVLNTLQQLYLSTWQQSLLVSSYKQPSYQMFAKIYQHTLSNALHIMPTTSNYNKKQSPTTEWHQSVTLDRHHW